MLLSQLGLAYERVPVDIFAGEAQTPPTASWLERVAATPGAIDDLEPYPAAAHASAGGRSAHDAR